MILLIRMSALCFSCIVHNLNSIMILLIQLSHLHNWFRVLQFKFHYDSINSSEGIKEYTCKTWFKFHYDSINSAVWIDCNEIISIYLNSIMILLILFIIIFFDFGFRLFKFHYDSINSRKEFADKAEIGVFKFHYDSINSTTGTIYRKLAFIDLNSIMILLIHYFR